MRIKQILTVFLVIVAVAALVGSGFFLGFRMGERMPQTIIVRGVSNLDQDQPAVVDFSTFWQAWKTVKDNYLNDKDVGNQDRVYGAIRGLVGSLHDPYSAFFNPEDSKKFQEDVGGSFGGIGAEIGIKKSQLVIIAPLKNTPAFRAGLKPNDQILKINATSTDGLTVDEAVRMIRGPEHTEVTLTIYREGWEKSKDFKIIRELIVAPTLDFEMKEGNIAYVQMHSFNSNLNLQFYEAMVKAMTQGARGIVLDLRNNPGGYLEVAVDMAGWFVPRGTIVVSEATRSELQQVYRAQGNAALVNTPVVVLVNEGSASASEILAGALRDQRHIKLVGEKSFGKGTVQQLLPLKDNSSLKITIAHWVLPSGQVLENGGLKPDVEVKMTDEDIDKKRDPQLEKAIEVLKSEMR